MTEREAIRKMLDARPDVAQMLRSMVASGQMVGYDSLPNIDCEQLIVLCGTDHGGIEGSKQLRCGCGVAIWMGPSTQEMIARRTKPVTVLCSSCGRKSLGEGKADA